MVLTVKYNHEVTKIAINNYGARTERQCVEFVTDQDALRIYNYDELLTISKSSFSLVTPFEYCVLIERVENLTVKHNDIFNFRRSRDWLLYGEGGFRLDNVCLRIEDNDMMITIEVPADATVSLDDEEIRFKEYAVINNEQVTNKH